MDCACIVYTKKDGVRFILKKKSLWLLVNITNVKETASNTLN